MSRSTQMPSATQAALTNLVQSLVPNARADDQLKNELLEVCNDILSRQVQPTLPTVTSATLAFVPNLDLMLNFE